MLKYCSVIIISSILFSCKQTIQIDKSELTQIYNDILGADSLKSKCYLVDSINNFKTKSITESDTTYFCSFCDDVKNGVWPSNLHNRLLPISKEKLHSISKTNRLNVTPIYYSFSLPYFSKDKQTFVIYYNLYCGILCQESSLRLYKKIDGKWTFIKHYSGFIS
jgi:hypothetical protein